MKDREKVIKGLEICTKDIPMSNAVHKSDLCKECPYYNAKYSYCWNQIAMMRDALALLKEQETQKFFVDESGKITPLPVVVRCKDCKHYRKDTCSAGAGMAFPPPDDWFCADGRRDE